MLRDHYAPKGYDRFYRLFGLMFPNREHAVRRDWEKSECLALEYPWYPCPHLIRPAYGPYALKCRKIILCQSGPSHCRINVYGLCSTATHCPMRSIDEKFVRGIWESSKEMFPEKKV